MSRHRNKVYGYYIYEEHFGKILEIFEDFFNDPEHLQQFGNPGFTYLLKKKSLPGTNFKRLS